MVRRTNVKLPPVHDKWPESHSGRAGLDHRRGRELTEVTLANPTGNQVKGALTADRRGWAVAEPLGFGTTYTWSGSAVGEDGARVATSSVKLGEFSDDHGDYYDWTLSWAQWQAKSALAS